MLSKRATIVVMFILCYAKHSLHLMVVFNNLILILISQKSRHTSPSEDGDILFPIIWDFKVSRYFSFRL